MPAPPVLAFNGKNSMTSGSSSWMLPHAWRIRVRGKVALSWISASTSVRTPVGCPTAKFSTILYKGYTKEAMNTARVFNPAATANDRQVLQGAIGLDSGR